MIHLIELGPRTRKLLRELLGLNSKEVEEIAKAMMASWLDMTPGERTEIEAKWKKEFRESFKNNGDTPEAPDDDETVCRKCGCTTFKPCGGCRHWVEPDLCSKCAERTAPERLKTPKVILSEPPRTKESGGTKPSPAVQEASDALAEKNRRRAAAEAEKIAVERTKGLPLCEFGCGEPVKGPTARYCKDHNNPKKRKSPAGPSIKLTNNDLAAVNDMVECPKDGKLVDIDDCQHCGSCVTRLKDPVTQLRYVRCLKANVQRKGS